MRIDNAGVVNIQDTNTNSTNKFARITGSHFLNAEQDILILELRSDTNDNILTFGGGNTSYNTAEYIDFWTATTYNTVQGVRRMRINSSGHVGINTTSMDEYLKVVGGNGNQMTLDNGGETWTQQNFANNGTDRTFIALDYANHNFIIGTQGSYSSFNSFRFRHAGTELVTIKPTGQVGIGTTTPHSYHASADNLVIKGSADAGMTIHSGTTSSSALGGIYFADGTSSSEQYRGYIYYNHSSDAGFSIGTSGTTSLILSGGTTPTFQFGGSTVFRTATGNMTFGTGATYTMLQGTYVQFTASNMVYISSGKMRMYDNIPLEFGNDYDASIKYVSGTGVWEFGGKPISVTGGGINLTDT